MIKRTLFEELKNHLTEKEITFIVGPRQAGKTTLMFLLKEHIEKQGARTLFFNLDIEADRRFFDSQEKFLSKIQLEMSNGKGYVFIDEVQRKEDAGVFLKGLYDLNLPYKFIVSGSGSIELKERIHESLVGRKRIFDLSTVSFREFADFKTNYAYGNDLSQFFLVHPEKTNELMRDYLSFGGYPRIVLEEQINEKRRLLDEIYSSYLEKDIGYLLGVQKEEAFTHLVRVLSSQTGNLTNIHELSSTLGISAKTVKHYIWYLEKTFILHRLTPYFRNVRKEITKSPVFYFSDLGLRNYALGQLGNMENERDVGFLFQNFILNILKERLSHTPTDIHFWRAKDGSEVDFVTQGGQKTIPVEAKYTNLIEPQVPRPLKSFILRYAPEQAFVVHLGTENVAQVNTTTIRFIPFYKLLFINFFS